MINCTWIDLSVRLISIHSFIHLCLFFYLVCLSIDLFWLIDWIGLEREERWKERMEEEEMTLDWHWLIENRVCSRNESWLVWLISFHWLIDEIDWWIEREQTTNFESNNEWLIDWQKRHIEDGWVGKEKFDWFNERNEWMNIIDWFDFICLSDWIDWDEWESFECFVIVLLLVWFDFYFVDWIIDWFFSFVIDWLIRLFVRMNWIDWLIEKRKESWQMEIETSKRMTMRRIVGWFVCCHNQLKFIIIIIIIKLDWMNEWMENWIDFNKQNKSSINSGGWLLKQQTNKQTTHSQWLVDWLIGNWKKVRHKNEIDFISLFTCFLWFGWLVCELIEFGIDWFGDDFQISLFLSFSHSLTWLIDWHLIKDWLFDVRWNQLSIVKDWWK